VTALIAWPNFILRDEERSPNSWQHPAETRTPNLHRAKQSLTEECGWKGGDRGSSADPIREGLPTIWTLKTLCAGWGFQVVPSTCCLLYSTAPRSRSRVTVLLRLAPPNSSAYPNAVHSTISPGRS